MFTDLILFVPFLILPVIWVVALVLRWRDGNANTLFEPIARTMGWR